MLPEVDQAFNEDATRHERGEPACTSLRRAGRLVHGTALAPLIGTAGGVLERCLWRDAFRPSAVHPKHGEAGCSYVRQSHAGSA